MSIDVDAETLISFRDATSIFPGRSVCLQTLHRWRLRGVRGVKLDTVLIGGLRYTSREAIDRFIAAQNAPVASTPTLKIIEPLGHINQGFGFRLLVIFSIGLRVQSLKLFIQFLILCFVLFQRFPF